MKAAQEAVALVQQVAEQVQNTAHQQLASVVSKSLAEVYEDPYEFAIRFERKRGRTEAKLVFTRDGQELENPAHESGGGAIDVAALALRLSCLKLMRPKKRMVLLLDETLRFIHGAGNRKRAARLLTSLARDAGVQIVLTTGHSWLHVGRVIEVGE